MLSSLPKLADKAFILGFFLLTLLFVIAFVALFYDQPWAEAWLGSAADAAKWDTFAYFVLSVWLLAFC